MNLSCYLSEKVIIPHLKGNTIEELVINIFEQLAEKNKNINESKDLMLEAVLKREAEITTYLGDGVAIPHARLEKFDDIIVAIGFPKNKVMVKTIDNKVEELKVLVLVVADILKGNKILKIMSGISKLALKNKEILDEIVENKNPSEIIKILDNTNIEVDYTVTAEDLMTLTPHLAKETNTLEDIAKIIISNNISGLPVVDENNNLLGEITEREMIAFCMPSYITDLADIKFMMIGDPFENYILNEKVTTIKDIYLKDGYIKVDTNASLMEICYLFMNKAVTRIYVVKERKYLGVILRSDIIRKILHI